MCVSRPQKTRKDGNFRSFRGFRVQIKFSAQSIFATSTKVRHLLNKIKMLSLCLHFGLCYGKSQLMRVLLFSGKPFLRLPKKKSLIQRGATTERQNTGTK